MGRGMFRAVSREELVNALTHGIGVIFSLVGLFVLAYRSLWYNNVAHTIAVSVYGVALVSVFASSTLHHITTEQRLKRIYLWLDHSCIYALIAGTYTPFMLTILKGATGIVVLSAVWGFGVLGIFAKTILKIRSDLISIPFYLLMGWMVVFVLQPFSSLIDPSGLVLLLVGGLCYSLGIVFFLLKLAYAHAVWHVLVLAGSALHYVCVLLYVTPS
ncbi:MAG: hemolysin III family protein [Chloroflexi bacterium]|nr:hemolysin III family protein [Chloroflexota bacterium]